MKDGFEFSFFVPGKPITGGSKTSIVLHKKGCPAGRRYAKGPCICQPRAVVFDSAGQRNKDWRYAVAQAGIEALRDNELAIITVPMRVTMVFFMPRPKGHYGKQGVLTKSAPVYHCVKPDHIKLARAVEDALNKVVWSDDSLIVSGTSEKKYSGRNITPGVLIRITVLPMHEDDSPVQDKSFQRLLT